MFCIGIIVEKWKDPSAGFPQYFEQSGTSFEVYKTICFC